METLTMILLEKRLNLNSEAVNGEKNQYSPKNDCIVVWPKFGQAITEIVLV